MKSSLATRGLGLMVLVASIPAAAQSNTFQKMDEAAIQRSLDVQAQVARIDQDKEAFIRDFIAGWTPYVSRSPLFSNFAKELQPLLRAATPWRLYAASLVGDYNGMVQVLRGEVQAGKVINALSSPQARTPPASMLTVGSASVLPDIGQTTSQLVFTPIPPCRIVDTRGTGARTGILAPFVNRTFDLTTAAFSKGQGGSTSCPGLPSFSHYGWSVNVTVTGYPTSGGYLQVWPFGGAVPATSFMNYGTTLPAIANQGTLTGCYGCGDDLQFRSSSSTHLVLDVYGYYEQATGFATSAAVTKVAGTTVTVGAGVYSFVSGGSCPAGTNVIGGAQTNSSSSGNTILTSDHNTSGTSWYEYVKNTGTFGASVTVYSICQDVT